VLVNASQRMLAVQLLEKKKDKKENDVKSEGHLLIKVATDGRFTVSTTPDPKGAAAAAGAGSGTMGASGGAITEITQDAQSGGTVATAAVAGASMSDANPNTTNNSNRPSPNGRGGATTR